MDAAGQDEVERVCGIARAQNRRPCRIRTVLHDVQEFGELFLGKRGEKREVPDRAGFALDAHRMLLVMSERGAKVDEETP
jgi:hypothetical protein